MASDGLYNVYANPCHQACSPGYQNIAKLMADMIAKLEEDAENVLRFMASNGLVANPSKT